MKNPNKPQHDEKKHSKEHKAPEKKAKKQSPEKQLPGAFYPVISGIVIIALLVLVIVLLVKNSGTSGGSGGTGISDGDKVKVEFYVMSQCPYGTQVEDAFYPVLGRMGDAVDFHLNYIVQESAAGQFQSLHGEPEVIGDIAQLCAMKYYPNDYKYMDFVICQNKDIRNVHTNWESCARENDMDVSKLRSCMQGSEGQELLRTSMQKAQEREARGSPTIFINDIPYQGQRDDLSFQRAVCKFTTHSACANIPVCANDADCTEQRNMIGVCNNPGQQDASCTYKEPVRVKYVVLTSTGCTGDACDAERIVQVTQQLFLGGIPKPVDVDSEEGKALVEKYGIEVVPAYIFDASVTDTNSWNDRPDLRTAFEEIGEKYKLRDEITGATYFVSEEARKAYEEEQRVGKQAGYDALGVEFDDNKPQIDFFVMSYCPYGNQAEEGIAPVYELLGDKAEFNPRYVIYSNYRGGGPSYCLDVENKLCSMHGIVELNQNVREVCVKKYMGTDKWFEFALAMNKEATSKNADDKWEGVAQKLGLDIDTIKKCEEEEAETLMGLDKEVGDVLGVSGSPTLFIDGESYSGARTPEAIKQALCAAFDEAPAECNAKLEGETTTQTPTGGCG